MEGIFVTYDSKMKLHFKKNFIFSQKPGGYMGAAILDFVQHCGYFQDGASSADNISPVGEFFTLYSIVTH